MNNKYPLAVFLISVLLHDLPAQENWPQWRGPSGNGIVEADNLPLTWNQNENIVWKTALPAWSGSTPVIWGNQIFLTSPSEAEEKDEAKQVDAENSDRRRGRGGNRNPGGNDLLLLCIDKKQGALLWQRKLDEGNKLYRKGNNTSPSPVTDGKHVWAVTGTGAVVAFDYQGKEIWRLNLQDDYGKFGHNWGYGSSPLLYAGKLIIEVLHGRKTDDPSYIVAFDARTGKEIWRQERPTDAVAESPDAYTTPALLQYKNQTQIVISGGDYVTGHDADSGKELWRASGLNPDRDRDYRIIASPVVANNMIYVPTRKKPLLALRAGGSGDISDSYLAWKWQGAAGTDVPTPVIDDKYFYMVDDRGLVICLNAQTGEKIWGPERTAQGNVSASPVLADGKIYIINEQAVTTVLKAGTQFELLATNELDGTYTLSSPVMCDSKLYLRTAKYLYCIGSNISQ